MRLPLGPQTCSPRVHQSGRCTVCGPFQRVCPSRSLLLRLFSIHPITTISRYLPHLIVSLSIPIHPLATYVCCLCPLSSSDHSLIASKDSSFTIPCSTFPSPRPYPNTYIQLHFHVLGNIKHCHQHHQHHPHVPHQSIKSLKWIPISTQTCHKSTSATTLP